MLFIVGLVGGLIVGGIIGFVLTIKATEHVELPR